MPEPKYMGRSHDELARLKAKDKESKHERRVEFAKIVLGVVAAAVALFGTSFAAGNLLTPDPTCAVDTMPDPEPAATPEPEPEPELKPTPSTEPKEQC